MNLANCSRCEKVFYMVPGGRDVCPACLKEEESNYLKVFHFFSSQPSATAEEISKETGVDIKEIYRYVRENRLRLVKTDAGIYCETCGAPVMQGKICDKCRQKLADEIKSDFDKHRQIRQSGSLKKSEERRDPKHLKDRRGGQS